MTAALALGGIGFALACLLGLARLALAGKEKGNANAVVDAIDELLPQSQCAQCGYPGCLPYARAVAAGARADLCAPGGPETAAKIRDLLGRTGDESNGVPTPVERVARIDAEDCVGCALCIAACPVDAIAGAPQFLHGVVAQHCTGCELCVPACPVDCIDMVVETARPATHADAGSLPPGADAAGVRRLLARDLRASPDSQLGTRASGPHCGRDARAPSAPAASFPPLPPDADAAALIARIEAAGIVGMGGGGYPTARKIREAAAAGADCVIGNGMASEPGTTADRALLREHGAEVAAGLALVGRALAGLAASATKRPAGQGADRPRLVLAVPPNSGLRTRFAQEVDVAFPAGDERRLVAAAVGRTVPHDGYPTDVGVLVLNVATLFAVYEAVELGRRPVKRLVTVGGTDAWQTFGTPLAELAQDATGGWRVNGALTGYDAPPDATITATTFAVDAPRAGALACIGCGWCVPACPEGLAPDHLHRVFAAGRTQDGVGGENRWDEAAACIECGACAAACPSGIDLVGEFRELKARVRSQQQARARAAAVRRRWQTREQRLAREARAADAQRAERMRAPRQW